MMKTTTTITPEEIRAWDMRKMTVDEIMAAREAVLNEEPETAISLLETIRDRVWGGNSWTEFAMYLPQPERARYGDLRRLIDQDRINLFREIRTTKKA